LKELKEEIACKESLAVAGLTISMDQLKALLARLEAAERYISLGTQSHGFDVREVKAACNNWKEVAGK